MRGIITVIIIILILAWWSNKKTNENFLEPRLSPLPEIQERRGRGEVQPESIPRGHRRLYLEPTR